MTKDLDLMKSKPYKQYSYNSLQFVNKCINN